MLVKVTGLTELRKALKAAEKYDPRAIRECMRGIASMLVPKMRARLRSLITTNRSRGSLESSIKPFGLISGSGVVMGTPARTAYAGWWEYGGPKKKSHRPPNRKFKKSGRAIYPTLEDSREEIWRETDKVVEKLSNIIMTH